ncbi:unnamed protein product [Ectocarpus sp. CCAP 1310/34]|nr:unnamed protein product [Ectocarpus sp. CCAP 1310/34]
MGSPWSKRGMGGMEQASRVDAIFELKLDTLL